MRYQMHVSCAPSILTGRLVDMEVPDPWVITEEFLDGFMCAAPGGLRVMVSANTQLDGRDWLHVSMSRKDRLPNYEEMTLVKEHFIGKDKGAIQIFAPESEHVNIHPRCLHLWSPLDHWPLPDFTRGTGAI